MSYFQRLWRFLVSGFSFRAVVLLAASLGGASFAAGQRGALKLSDVAGAYECSVKDRIVLFSDGRWFKGRGFDSASFKITWLDPPIHSFRTKQVHLQLVHGRFQIEGDRIVLYTLQPGITHWGVQSIFDKPVPDALLIFERWFRVDKISGEFVEVRRYSADREASRCRRDGLF